MGLVGQLVLGKARVAVDSEERALGVAGEREASERSLPREVSDEAAERPQEFVVVNLLARLEPVALVVALEIAEEVEAFGAEAGERGEVVVEHSRGDG